MTYIMNPFYKLSYGVVMSESIFNIQERRANISRHLNNISKDILKILFLILVFSKCKFN